MIIERKSFIKLLEKLEGTNWCFFAGLAVMLHSGENRKIGDLDIIVHQKDLDDFARKLGTRVEKRSFRKDSFFVEDFGFTVNFMDLKIEASSGFPVKRMKEGTFEKVLANKVEKKFLGFDVFVTPIEEVLAHKGSMGREKDLKDLKCLIKKRIDYEFLKELIKDWGEGEGIIGNLEKAGYKII